MTESTPTAVSAAEDDQLAALEYGGDFARSMSHWSDLALGFTYLSPLVGPTRCLPTASRSAGWPASGGSSSSAPYDNSEGIPEGDAIEVAERLRRTRSAR